MSRSCGTALVAAVLCVLTSVAAGAADAPKAKAQFLPAPDAAQSDLPFTEAVRAGDFIFLAGQIGGDPATGKLVPGGIVPEARQTLKHIQAALERNGSSLSEVVKCTVFLADIAEWGTFNGVYREFFKKPFPARSAFAASGLAQNARVELECIAYRRGSCAGPSIPPWAYTSSPNRRVASSRESGTLPASGFRCSSLLFLGRQISLAAYAKPPNDPTGVPSKSLNASGRFRR